MPFVIALFVIIHLLFLHNTGSSNPLGLSFNMDKVRFGPYFSVKDLLGALFFFLAFRLICFFYP